MGAFLRTMAPAAQGQINAPWAPAAVVHQAGDMLVVPIAGHVNFSGSGFIPPQQMNNSYSGTNVNGYLYLGGWQGGSSTPGSTDVGAIAARFWARLAATSAQAPPVLPEGPNLPLHTHIAIGLDAGFAFQDTLVSAVGANQGMALPSAQMGSVKGTYDADGATSVLSGTIPIFDNPAKAGDVIILVMGLPTDSGDETVAVTMTAAGLTGGTKTKVAIGAGTGIDGGYACVVWEGFTGTQTGGVAVSWPLNPIQGSGASGALSAFLVRATSAYVGVPTNVQVTADPNVATKMTLTWEAPATGVALGYRIRSNLGGAIDSGAAIDVGNVLSFPFINVPRRQTFFYEVQAYDANGSSPWVMVSGANPGPILRFANGDPVNIKLAGGWEYARIYG